MASNPTVIIFVGGMEGSPVEEMVAAAHRAIARDVIERVQATGAFERVIVVTDGRGFEVGGSVAVEVEQGSFHFGRELYEIIHKYGLDRPFYIGGGCASLLSEVELAAIARQLSMVTDSVITNNFFSADLMAFTPGSAIESVDLPPRDNDLARLLSQQAGLEPISLPRTAATQLDVDTPTDLMVLALHPATGHHLRAYLATLDLDTTRLRQATSLFADRMAEVLVAGRVGSHLWAQLEQDTACRVRVLSEERGMAADGRESEGEVRSILGYYLEEVDPAHFFDTIAQLGDAAFIDTRVIFEHLGLDLSRSDRFLSDLGQTEEIENPFLREFTKAALGAPIPVALGAHSLVSGGLLALVEVGRETRLPGA